MSPKHWPSWWEWDLEFVPHLLKRMADRDFNEVDLRQMLERATGYHVDVVEGRFVIETRHGGKDWKSSWSRTIKKSYWWW